MQPAQSYVAPYSGRVIPNKVSALDESSNGQSTQRVELVAPARPDTPGLLALKMSYDNMIASTNGFRANLAAVWSDKVSARDIAAALDVLPKDVLAMIKGETQ